MAGTWSKGGDGCGVGAAAVAAGTAPPAAGSAALCTLSARPLQRFRSAPAVKHDRLPNLDALLSYGDVFIYSEESSKR